MTNQIIFPAEYGRLTGRITFSVQDSPVIYTIFARRKNGDYIDITGATIDAKFELISTGAVYDSTGTFTIVDGMGGEFTWLPSAADLGLAGSFYLQFTIDGERSEDDLVWEVQARLDSDGSTPPTAMTSLTAAQVALVAVIQGLTGLVKMAGGVASAVLIKLDGTTAPGVNDDSGDGYGIGSIWIDTTNDNAYIATDVTVGAANWLKLNSAGDLTTHAALTLTAHGGLLPQDALFSQQSGDYAIQSGDAGKNVEVSAAATVTLPNGLDTGFQCVVMRTGSGAVTIAATTTLQKLTAGTGLETVASVALLTAAVVTHRGSNVWLVTGDYS